MSGHGEKLTSFTDRIGPGPGHTDTRFKERLAEAEGNDGVVVMVVRVSIPAVHVPAGTDPFATVRNLLTSGGYASELVLLTGGR